MNRENNNDHNTSFDNEDIMKQMNSVNSNIEIPESLSPENMMKKINMMKKENTLPVKPEKGMNRIGKGLIGGISIAVLIFAVFIGKIAFEGRTKQAENSVIKTSYDSQKLLAGEGTGVVKSVTGRDEIKNAIVKQIKKEYLEGKHFNYIDSSKGVGDIAMNETSGAVFDSIESSESDRVMFDAAEEDSDYYRNNDQVEGVVEADKVLTDGKYIYTLQSNDHVTITDVNGEKIEHIVDIDFADSANEHMNTVLNTKEWSSDEFRGYLYDPKFYITENNMVIILEYNLCIYGDDIAYNGYNDAICASGGQETLIIDYDISDIKSPKLKEIHMVEGDFVSSRMVQNYLYVITNRRVGMSVGWYGSVEDDIKRIEENCIPRIDGEEMSCDNIYMTDGEIEDYEYEIVTAFKINDENVECTDSSAVLGGASDIYVSSNYIYTYFEKYVREEEKSGERTKIKGHYETKIYKFAYADGELEAYAAGNINGYVLNQFSLDEYNGYLRVVSSIEEWSYYEYDVDEWLDDIPEYEDEECNALYILDEYLNTCGSIEDIAEGETIYSARFSGNKGYFVTFRQMDPLFVADLSDVNNPVITDELEMTGYSDYLQKWDEDTLLGVGVEADTDGRKEGLKLALYDVSDDNQLEEITKYVMEDWYNYDNYDYKNMLVAPEKSLFGMSIYDDENWKNHYIVFSIENGEIKPVLDYFLEDYSDVSKDEKIQGYEFYEGDTVHYDDDVFAYDYDEYSYRAVYAGNYLYIVTLDRGISAVNLDDYSVINFVSFS